MNPSLFLWAQAGSEGETGEGVALLHSLGTLVPGLESLPGSLDTLDLYQQQEAPRLESLFLQLEDSLCGSDLPQLKAFVSGPWEDENLCSRNLGDENGGVEGERNEKGE